MLIGYARVSTRDQNPALQRDALQQADCEKIYEDKASGACADREGLKQALDVLREGDTLVVWKLDRFGRSLKDLLTLVNELADRGVQFRSLTDNIDTSTPSGRFFFHVMASLAEMERELNRERTLASLDAARKQGKLNGRARVMNESKITAAKRLVQDGMSHKEVALHLKITLPTLYRWVPATERTEQAA